MTLCAFVLFISSVKASNAFYLGDHVPDIYIYMNRIDKKVYRQFRMIYQSGTNELVYCIEPGATLSSGEYNSFEEFNEIFNLSEENFNKLKLIAYYGYQYDNHTDIKWYAITQYIIWKEIMPSSWEMYFTDKNHNKLDNLFSDEINEIYNLVNNHSDSLNILNKYILNNEKTITIKSNNLLSNYTTNVGRIDNNTLILDSLDYGNNNVKLTFNNYKKTLFYFNEGGQNIMLRGDIFQKNIDLDIYVQQGRVNITECNEETFFDDFIGGTYEVLSDDDEVLDEITCTEDGCLSGYLPVGYHKIRVKSLPLNFEKNEHIYDIEVIDNEENKVSVCSLPKHKEEKIIDHEPEHDEAIKTIEYEDEVDIPYTSKNELYKYMIFFIMIIITILWTNKNENTN